jgi:hypothetical protein
MEYREPSKPSLLSFLSLKTEDYFYFFNPNVFSNGIFKQITQPSDKSESKSNDMGFGDCELPPNKKQKF